MELLEGQTKLEVTEQGIIVLDAGADAHPATLLVMAQPYLEVLHNGEKVTGRRTIHGSDSIQVNLYDTPAGRKAWVEISQDKMHADLHIRYEAGVRRNLRSVAPSADARVELVETPVTPEPFHLDEIKEILGTEGISFQIDLRAIEALLEKVESGTCICASGTRPSPTEPEHYEIVVGSNDELTLIGIVPLRPVISVQEGVIVAEHRARVEGTPGKNVLGEVVPPEPVVSRLPNLGKGVTRTNDGSILSTRSGRLIESSNLLDVAETWTMESSVKASDGYIVFDGDVVIQGDVEEGVEISAGGTVFVSGSVSMATISADEGIVVSGGVFASTLKAGLRVISLQRLAIVLDKLCDELDKLMMAVAQVQTSLSGRGVDLPAGKVAAKLLEEPMQDCKLWPQLIREWADENGKAAGPTWIKFAESLGAELSYTRLTSVRDTMAWKMLISLLQRKLGELPALATEPADIQVRNAQNSTLESTGSIISTTQGYYQCQLTAGKSLKAQGHPGVILACRVMAEEVEAREIGSQAEANTTIELSTTEGSVKAATVHPGTMFSVSTWKHKVSKEMKNVTWP